MRPCFSLGFGLAAVLLTACAAPHPVARPAAAATAPRNVLVTGIIAAIRPFQATTPAPALWPSTLDVLAVLQVPPPEVSVNATEFVIQRDDGTVAAIVVRSPAGSPHASLAGSSFAVGDRVKLINGMRTELIHSD